MTSHPTDDLLIDLSLRLLETGGSDSVLDHVRACHGCENRFRELCREQELLRLRPRPTMASGRLTAPMDTGGEDGTASEGSRLFAWGAGAAFAAVVLLLSIELMLRQAGDPLDYWLPVEAESVVFRSENLFGAKRFSEALDAYGRQDARQVVELLEASPLPDESDYDPLKLVLASALVRERRYAEARALLEKLDIETLPLPARDRARWILLTALWRSGDLAAAEPIRRELASRQNEFTERASRLDPRAVR
ncbi:MAG: hypothetical protein ACREAA_14390 [Candidatus Polarisedimenticolia bacterium]